MGWERYIGHGEQIARFRGIVSRGRLGHTWLFLGPPGVGKRTFAQQLAQCLFCDRIPEDALDACGQCGGCKQVAAGTHPDFFQVGCPEGKRELPIEVFLGPPERRGKAGLCYDLSHTPMGGRRKIAIIDDADLLNDASGNALLKTLEEPPAHSLLILIGSNLDGILPTIRSRCQMLRFRPLATQEVTKLLLREGLADDPRTAAEAAALSDGSLTTASQMLLPELRAQREQLFAGLAAANFNSVGLAHDVLEAVTAAGETAEQRRHARWMVHFCVEFYRSSLWLAAGGPEAPNTAAIPAAAQIATRLPVTNSRLDQLAALLDRAMLAEDHIEQNITVPLCVESLFDDLGQLQRSM